MSLRRAFLLLASIGLSVLLIALLIRVGKIDLRETLSQLQRASRIAFVKLILLNALLILLSTEKWRSVDAALRRSSDAVPSRTTSFAVTSAGMALGLVLPVQLGMATARTLGTYFYGRALKRGTVGTLFEQSFDVLIVCFLAVASGATWLCGGGLGIWTVLAAAMIALALLAVEPSMRLIRWLASRAATSAITSSRTGAIVRHFSELKHSGLLSVGLGRRLTTLSALRFAVIVLMAGQTAEAVGTRIPLWHFAAAVPFVVIATIVAVTPGGIGVNELTIAVALNMVGTPLTVAAQWALTNRFLATASCFVVGACAAAMLGLQKIVISGASAAKSETKAEEI